jgi:hypothetical protein
VFQGLQSTSAGEQLGIRRIGSRRGTTDGPGLGFELGDHTGHFMGIDFA